MTRRLGDTEACARAFFPFLDKERKVPLGWEDLMQARWRAVHAALRRVTLVYDPVYWGTDVHDPDLGLAGTPRTRAWKALHKLIKEGT